MESLSDVIKSMASNKHEQQKQESVQQMRSDPHLLNWLSQHPQLTEDDLKSHVNVLYQFVSENRNCSHCPGLDKCPNDFVGHYTMLTTEPGKEMTHLYDFKVACKKLIAKQTQDQIRSRVRSFYVDEASLRQGYSPEEILDLDLERAKAVGTLLTYIDKTKREGLQKQGLYLCGELGTGKTFLMGYLLYELAKIGLNGAIVYMPDFSEDLKAMFSEPQRLKETIDLLKETDLLVLDDIGAENMNPWLRDHVLAAILNYRMNRKPTFFTSNYELDDLERHFSFTNKDGEEEFKGKRIMDRIRPFVRVEQVGGFNKRNSLYSNKKV